MADTSMSYPEIKADTIPKYLRVGKESWGNRIYMREKDLGIWQQYSWNEVYEHVRLLTLGLLKLGLKKGETVALAGENTPQLFWAYFAAMAAGGKIVCLYPDMTPGEVEYILDHSDTVYLVAEDQEQVDKYLDVREQLPDVRRVIYWDERGMWQYEESILTEFSEVLELGREYGKANPDLFEKTLSEGKGSDIAVLSYTSGTTGVPKGVILTQDYLLDNGFRIHLANRFKPFTKHLSYLSPAWATEHFYLAASLIAPFVYNFPEKPETVLKDLRELGAEVMVFGPRQWESLISTVQVKMGDAGPIRRAVYRLALKTGEKVNVQKAGNKGAGLGWRLLHPLMNLLVLSQLRDNLGMSRHEVAVTGGAPTSPDVFNMFHAMGIKLRNGYGSTEIGTVTQHVGDHFAPETLGKWNPSHPAFGDPLEWKIDEDGGLLIRGASGFSGYYKNPEATAKETRDGWFVTGDAVRVTDEGELIFLDRLKDLRKLSNGHPYPPQFIETRLRFSPYIKDAMVLGDETKSFVAAFVNIDAETVGQWAEKHAISYTTFPDLSQNPQVCDLIRKEVERVNGMLEAGSQVTRFVNLPKELDPDEAELTRTRKLRRGLLEERYDALVQAMYGGKNTFETDVPVKYRDGRTGTVKNHTKINTI